MTPPAEPHGPHCPLCSEPPRWLLAGGTQAFCVTPGCLVITWDPTVTTDELIADVHFIDIAGGA